MKKGLPDILLCSRSVSVETVVLPESLGTSMVLTGVGVQCAVTWIGCAVAYQLGQDTLARSSILHGCFHVYLEILAILMPTIYKDWIIKETIPKGRGIFKKEKGIRTTSSFPEVHSGIPVLR